MTTMPPSTSGSMPRTMPYDPALRTTPDNTAALPAGSYRPMAETRAAARSLFGHATWWPDRRRLSLRQLRQEVAASVATTPDGVMERLRMLERLDADLAVAEQAWHPNAGPDVAWPMSILKARYRGIGKLLQSR